MPRLNTDLGFALMSVVWITAIISVLSITMVGSYVTNTRATQIEIERIQAEHLMNAGIRVAALSLTSPRTVVAIGAIPQKTLTYRASEQTVQVEINNESAFVDLVKADPDLLKALLASYGLTEPKLSDILAKLSAFEGVESSGAYRRLSELFSGDANLGEPLYKSILNKATLYNGQSGVHPELASAEVLALLSDLPAAERDLLLKMRAQKQASLFSSPIESRFFSKKISPYYRVRVTVVLNGREYSRRQIIKVLNQQGQLFEISAGL